MQLQIKGKIFAIARKEYEGEVTEKIQFLNQLDNGGAEIVEVKMLETDQVKQNDQVIIPVKVTSYNGKLFYSQVDKIIKAS
jgi:hypothetical protein